MSAITTDWECVAVPGELSPGERKSIFVDDVPALLIRVQDDYFAVEDVCTHDGQPLTEGQIVDQAITCPRHGARFDLKTGKPLCMPATQPIEIFGVDVRADGIFARRGESGLASVVPTPPVPAASVATASAGEAASEPAGTLVADDVTNPGSTTVPVEPSTANVDSDAELDDAQLIDALRQVIDPELMVNIVDLGLVYSINHADRKAVVEMTLTSPACPAGPQIVQQAKMVIERLPQIDEAQIKLTMSPPWTPDRMTDEARDQLGFF